MVETHHEKETAPLGTPRGNEEGSSNTRHNEHPEPEIPMDREGPSLHIMFNDLHDRVTREQR